MAGAAGERDGFTVVPVGRVASPLTDPAAAPKQGTEGAPDAWIELDPAYRDAVRDIAPGDRLLVLTWLDRARRDVQRVRPRDEPANPETGVFSTRSQDRPNPLGLHPVDVLAVDGLRLRVRHLEAVDGTPVLDIKPEISSLRSDGPPSGPRSAPPPAPGGAATLGGSLRQGEERAR
ncbi:MAG TPA: tRNA (N6-threonylcarbamoyladenosine(37)-N6)-methyltransferase TrmO [Acidimicrobiales bacterium]